MTFKLANYVHGAAFSKDMRTIILVTGPKEPAQGTKLNLSVIDVATRKETTFRGQVDGRLPQSEATSNIVPISFIDDGKEAYFTLQDPDPNKYEETRYRYNWSKKKLSRWEPPISVGSWSWFQPSDDGRYRFYSNGLYDEETRLISFEGFLNHPFEGGMWIPQTHDLARLETVDNVTSLIRLNADTLQESRYDNIPLKEHRLQAASIDGKRLYLSARKF